MSAARAELTEAIERETSAQAAATAAEAESEATAERAQVQIHAAVAAAKADAADELRAAVAAAKAQAAVELSAAVAAARAEAEVQVAAERHETDARVRRAEEVATAAAIQKSALQNATLQEALQAAVAAAKTEAADELSAAMAAAKAEAAIVLSAALAARAEAADELSAAIAAAKTMTLEHDTAVAAMRTEHAAAIQTMRAEHEGALASRLEQATEQMMQKRLALESDWLAEREAASQQHDAALEEARAAWQAERGAWREQLEQAQQRNISLEVATAEERRLCDELRQQYESLQASFAQQLDELQASSAQEHHSVKQKTEEQMRKLREECKRLEAQLGVAQCNSDAATAQAVEAIAQAKAAAAQAEAANSEAEAARAEAQAAKAATQDNVLELVREAMAAAQAAQDEAVAAEKAAALSEQQKALTAASEVAKLAQEAAVAAAVSEAQLAAAAEQETAIQALRSRLEAEHDAAAEHAAFAAAELGDESAYENALQAVREAAAAALEATRAEAERQLEAELAERSAQHGAQLEAAVASAKEAMRLSLRAELAAAVDEAREAAGAEREAALSSAKAAADAELEAALASAKVEAQQTARAELEAAVTAATKLQATKLVQQATKLVQMATKLVEMESELLTTRASVDAAEEPESNADVDKAPAEAQAAAEAAAAAEASGTPIYKDTLVADIVFNAVAQGGDSIPLAAMGDYLRSRGDMPVEMIQRMETFLDTKDDGSIDLDEWRRGWKLFAPADDVAEEPSAVVPGQYEITVANSLFNAVAQGGDSFPLEAMGDYLRSRGDLPEEAIEGMVTSVDTNGSIDRDEWRRRWELFAPADDTPIELSRIAESAASGRRQLGVSTKVQAFGIYLRSNALQASAAKEVVEGVVSNVTGELIGGTIDEVARIIEIEVVIDDAIDEVVRIAEIKEVIDEVINEVVRVAESAAAGRLQLGVSTKVKAFGIHLKSKALEAAALRAAEANEAAEKAAAEAQAAAETAAAAEAALASAVNEIPQSYDIVVSDSLFNAVAQGGDSIPLAAMGDYLRSRGDMPVEMIQRMETFLDTNDDGSIDLDEWRRGWKLFAPADDVAEEPPATVPVEYNTTEPDSLFFAVAKMSIETAQGNAARLIDLQADLKQAVEVEDYTKAAELMPQIKQLKATIEAAAAATDKVGSAEAAQRNTMRLTELQADLKQAVEVEDYANVAELMPKIKQLKATIKAAAVATDKESDSIPLAEMGAFLRSRGDLPEERIESIVTSMDINGNGRIDLKGWRRGWKLYVLKDGMAKEVAEEVIKEVISNAIDEVARVAEIAEVIDEVIGEAAQVNESAAAGRLQLISLLSKDAAEQGAR
eukprot:jgi/Chrpa1/2498/Chrysochromulina_OHIO_Genome00001346-RA